MIVRYGDSTWRYGLVWSGQFGPGKVRIDRSMVVWRGGGWREEMLCTRGRVFVPWLAWLVAIIITQIKRPRDLISQSVTSLHLNCCCFLFSNPVFFFCYLCRVCVCIWWTPIRHSLLIQRAIDDLCRPFNESARFNYAQAFHYSHPHPLSTTEQTKIVIYRPLSGLVFTLSSLLLAYSNSKTWAQFFLVSDWRSIGINRNDRITLFSSLVIYSINISYLLESISAIAFL